MKFLIIEDEYISLRLMQEILLNYGYCDTAMNGKDAIGKFSLAHNIGKPYDVILLDIMLPDMDGYQILSHIRKIEEEKNILFSDGVKVIVTSALDDVKSIQKAFREQCEFYLVKPINQAKLESIFKKINLI
ncbi:MAG: hypothetical protein A2086_00905 [Spirochaetes bacterium GWD1_27_9]|nr:MAG: hypothetical protein A2Z98_03890 [Spirochaetes bacterium GWB1_27_13]OHD26796.1 MAG: hypothetical protein A2Y34_18020 [Spirochaetes bacterium GWC1_27_15]OHD33668.1 MAG: hypothetical protein A2086_00905 [Spirochaetes bacterium GWD1_27_9]